MTPELAEALRAGPFHTALRVAIQTSGLGLDRIRHRLAMRGITVSTTSLSYWQSGRSRPERAESLAAVTALEDLLELPAGSLRTRPDGGMSVWARLPGDRDADELLQSSLDHEDASVRGLHFLAGQPDLCTLRLSFTAHDVGEIRDGLGRLAAALG